jgi:hypothetical protein
MTTTTRTPRLVVGIAAIALLASALTGCVFLPSLPSGSGSDTDDTGSGDATTSELAGTTWRGIDSDGDSWGLDLQDDGTVGLTYGGESYDDATDVWAQAGDTVTFHIGFDDGDIDMIGQYAGLDAPMETTGTYDGGTFTVTLTRE